MTMEFTEITDPDGFIKQRYASAFFTTMKSSSDGCGQ